VHPDETTRNSRARGVIGNGRENFSHRIVGAQTGPLPGGISRGSGMQLTAGGGIYGVYINLDIAPGRRRP
jgi:hypothetical protein